MLNSPKAEMFPLFGLPSFCENSQLRKAGRPSLCSILGIGRKPEPGLRPEARLNISWGDYLNVQLIRPEEENSPGPVHLPSAPNVGTSALAGMLPPVISWIWELTIVML